MEHRSDLAPIFGSIDGVTTRSNVPGSSLTTFAIGGPVAIVAEVSKPEALPKLLSLLQREGGRARILGAGSNLLIPDRGMTEPVIHLGQGFRAITELGGGRFRIGAGASLMSTSRTLSQGGWSGLEYAGGIPATMGGAIVMNAGAHQGSTADIVEEIEFCSVDGSMGRLSARELRFGYRHAELPVGACVTAVTVALTASDPERTTRLRAENLAYRKRTQPLSAPSAGSVFRNPSVEAPAGRLLEAAGMKGVAEGGVLVSELHANWIINPDRKGVAEDVKRLISRCQDAVRARSGELLRPELVIWE